MAPFCRKRTVDSRNQVSLPGGKRQQRQKQQKLNLFRSSFRQQSFLRQQLRLGIFVEDIDGLFEVVENLDFLPSSLRMTTTGKRASMGSKLTLVTAAVSLASLFIGEGKN